MDYKNHCMSITHKIHSLVFLMDKMADQILSAGADVSYSQYRIVMAVYSNPDLSQKDVAKYLNVTQAAVSRQVEVLEKRSLVARHENTRNRREYVLRVTALGDRIFRQSYSLLEKRFDELFAVLDEPGYGQFEESIELLLGNIETEGKVLLCKGKCRNGEEI